MAELVRSVMVAGHALRISVLAQGIETADQLAAISSRGCDEGQGYLIGHPTQMAPTAPGMRPDDAHGMRQPFAARPLRAAASPLSYPEI